ncbi:hypothetical protein pdul_cds_158 [Pandoravirus dulcis]|uniref:Uncharacterized protein n=1 Tax=Pandoravirus dulcis TaxID=1349409 RepID=A0A291ATW7_9VIRU|nr:hypothetical protein pdul_cds_158 [Pandoravirus dulcis]ATE82471.1 hypothetical protein pdul_cds_158 [Pandoravirus dulcis]
MEDDQHIFVSPDVAQAKAQEGTPCEETTGPCEPTGADAKPAKPFWHFTEHLKWGATAEGQRQLAKYPQVKPRSKEEEEQHQAFGRRIMARYGAPE